MCVVMLGTGVFVMLGAGVWCYARDGCVLLC